MTTHLSTVPQTRGEVYGSGYDGRYRLYTVDHLPFGALPSYRDGGPAKVVNEGWSKSTSSICPIFSSPEVVAADDRKHTLRLHQHPVGVRWSLENDTPHALNGTRYATQDEADKAAYEVGATAFMVYHRDAAKWGLPDE